MITIDDLLIVRDKAVLAVNKLKVGDEFQGAFHEAEAAGYECQSIEYNVFCTLYVSLLPVVTIDGFGFVVSITPK